MKQSSITDFQFLYDHILIEPVASESVHGLVNPEQYDDKPEFGIVVLCGEGRLMDDGTVVPLHVKQGDEVLYNKYSTSQLRHQGKDYLMLREYDVVAVRHEGNTE